jgi:hypothetical protein
MRELLIVCDSGGSNSYRLRLWKYSLWQLASQQGIAITVCHYPPGASKWNPADHRLFSFISLNWAGQPLRTVETMVGYIRDTTTTTGLRVTASLLEGVFQTGKRVTEAVMKTLHVEPHAICPQWNYTIHPRLEGAHAL